MNRVAADVSRRTGLVRSKGAGWKPAPLSCNFTVSVRVLRLIQDTYV